MVESSKNKPLWSVSDVINAVKERHGGKSYSTAIARLFNNALTAQENDTLLFFDLSIPRSAFVVETKSGGQTSAALSHDYAERILNVVAAKLEADQALAREWVTTAELGRHLGKTQAQAVHIMENLTRQYQSVPSKEKLSYGGISIARDAFKLDLTNPDHPRPFIKRSALQEIAPAGPGWRGKTGKPQGAEPSPWRR